MPNLGAVSRQYKILASGTTKFSSVNFIFSAVLNLQKNAKSPHRPCTQCSLLLTFCVRELCVLPLMRPTSALDSDFLGFWPHAPFPSHEPPWETTLCRAIALGVGWGEEQNKDASEFGFELVITCDRFALASPHVTCIFLYIAAWNDSVLGPKASGCNLNITNTATEQVCSGHCAPATELLLINPRKEEISLWFRGVHAWQWKWG